MRLANLRDDIERALHLNGCQQRTSGYNEARAGKELDINDTELMEKAALDEVMKLVTDFCSQGFELHHCAVCNSMTNHLFNECQRANHGR